MAAGNGKKKSKVFFTVSTGLVDKGGSALEAKVSCPWYPGSVKGKKRKGKGHNKFGKWQNK